MRDVKSGFFIFCLSLFVICESVRAGLGSLREPGSGFLSFCAGVTLAILSLLLVYRGWGIHQSLETHSRRVIFAFILLLAYSLSLDILGFPLTTFFLVGILFRLGEPRPWWVLVGMSMLVTLLSYWVFGVLLEINFPRGFLGL